MFDGTEELIDESTVIPTQTVAPKPTNDLEALKERKRLKLKSLKPQEPAQEPASTNQPTAPQKETAVTKPKLKKAAPAKPSKPDKPVPSKSAPDKPVPSKSAPDKPGAVEVAKAAKAKKLAKLKSAHPTPPAGKPAAKTEAEVSVPRVRGKAATSIKRAVAKGKAPAKKPSPAKKVVVPKEAPAEKTKVLSARAKAIIAKAAKRVAPPLKVAAPSTAVSRKGKALKSRAPGSANGAYAQVPKYKCMCCGKPSTGKFFKRGHIWAFNRAIVEIASGETTPDKALPAFVAKAMGPWTKIKGAGLKPAVANYEKAYAIANAKS